ncbi:hypothetical protein GCM10009665_54300 [Kitasatospora nipponensis]|uniref:Lipoprotein n=1 Tax=Kitasatospora nipponensis TaxID=258049 RepID=A0ABN1WNA8_9ACTN
MTTGRRSTTPVSTSPPSTSPPSTARRGPALRATALLGVALATLAAGCTSGSAGGTRELGGTGQAGVRSSALPTMPTGTLAPAGGVPSGPAAARAAQVARAWPGSAMEQRRQARYWPWNVPVAWPPAGGFHSDADQQAVRDGRVDLPAGLPDAPFGSPALGQVRWADGSTLSLPLLPPAQALRSSPDRAARTTTPDPSCAGACSARLTVTAIHPGTRQVLTTRGQATIPTWEFSVAGYPDPVVYPAIARSGDPGGEPPVPDLGIRELTWTKDWTATSTDGLTISAHETYGACEAPAPGRVYETDQLVVLIGQKKEQPPGTACTAQLLSFPAEFRLSRPLGDRVVLDASTGDAVSAVPEQWDPAINQGG